jgi:hypothetical protein
VYKEKARWTRILRWGKQPEPRRRGGQPVTQNDLSGLNWIAYNAFSRNLQPRLRSAGVTLPPLRYTPTCPECGQAFAVVWSSENAPRHRALLQCPRTDGGIECSGMVELDVPQDAQVMRSGGFPDANGGD